MRQREIFRRETTRFQQRDGQRIAHHQRGGGAGGRRQPQRAGFLRHLDAQVDIRRFAHRASGLLVIQMRVICWRFNTGISAEISLDSPELEMASTMSCGVTMPKSPWLASAG